MFCKNCGEQLAEGSKFCGGCGAVTTIQQGQSQGAYQNSAGPPVSLNLEQHGATPPQPQRFGRQQNLGNFDQPNRTQWEGNVPPLSVKDFLISFLLLSVPILNLVLLFLWGFRDNVNPNKRNLARATLIIYVIAIILWFVAGAAMVGILSSMGM